MAQEQFKFTIVGGNDKEDAKTSFDMGRYSSPYQPGVKFTVTDWARVKRDVYDEEGNLEPDDGKRYPVLKTKITDFDSYIFVSTIVAAKPTSTGGVCQADGEVNCLVRKKIGEMLAGDKSDAEILTAVYEMLKDKVIVVTRKPYIGLTKPKEGKLPTPYVTSVVNLDFESK